ncbi:hypothetical protein SAMN04487895_103243 [Paenibacillus sophorae]|uniref:DUF1349 domain-containing protein n=1 Tax=Paenibacillus sophorae TaxID=1333845 RepID=A0A1H8K1S4_9BACL|nr:DUF1349 domain-containing protein [Paenibacillus sophorae]QWU13568.1 DUF1349 domain-containing protein [Paenibacillus sophorae]SEN86872.1 hypothetical protein SAMN04487895_103243 [Paenibacillus sophorae]
MTIQTINWPDGIWTNQPVSSRVDRERLIVEAAEHSDYWQQTMYGFQHDSGHALLHSWERQYAAEASFKLDHFSELYDQAGLMLWHSPSQWIKSGIEINDGVPHIGAVVTDTYSDWSLSPVPEWAGQEITIRASRLNDAVIIRARADRDAWRTVRVARFPYLADVQAGPFLCAPTRSGFQVTFTRWVLTSPDEDIHTDPPAEA